VEWSAPGLHSSRTTPCSWSGRTTPAACNWNDSHIIASTGAYFFDLDAMDGMSAGIDIPDQPGVYAIRNGKGWYSRGDGWTTDDESGVDGDIVPATVEDLERFGFTPEELLDELRETMDDYEEGLLAYFQGSGAPPQPWAAGLADKTAPAAA
jgi:hypothetical protein